MNRYLVFGYNEYYPEGGMHDCIYKCNQSKDLKHYFLRNDTWRNCDNVHIYDMKEDKIYMNDTLFDAF